MELYPSPSRETLAKLETGRRALVFFMEHSAFREAFFTWMRPNLAFSRTRSDIEKMVSGILDDIKPSLSEVEPSQQNYKNLRSFLHSLSNITGKAKNINQMKKRLETLWLINRPGDIYDNYWNGVKKNVVNKVLDRIELQAQSIVRDSLEESESKRLCEDIRAIGGNVDDLCGGMIYKKNMPAFSVFKGNGPLFEWMTASLVVDTILQSGRMREQVSDIFINVETKRADDETINADTEMDIVLTTRFGTLIIFEMKTYDFTGDIVKSKEDTAYKKSGIYGKAIMVGPLLRSMVIKKEDGSKEYPHYIDPVIKSQEETAGQNAVEYIYIDELPDILKKKLYVQGDNIC